jgi:hypothetical protein
MLTFVLNLLMLSRLDYTANDTPINKKKIPYILIIQALGLDALMINRAWVALLIFSIIANTLNFYWESKSKNPRIVRIISLIAFAIIYSAIISLSGQIQFNPIVISWAKRINDTFLIVKNLGQLSQINTYALGLLFIINESNTIIRQLFDWIKISPELSNNGDLDDLAVPLSKDVIKIDDDRSGRVIGILERLFVYFAVMKSEYSIIGFILAAKAFARFKELEKKPYAEYVLIGTLASIFIALITASFISMLVK